MIDAAQMGKIISDALHRAGNFMCYRPWLKIEKLLVSPEVMAAIHITYHKKIQESKSSPDKFIFIDLDAKVFVDVDNCGNIPVEVDSHVDNAAFIFEEEEIQLWKI